MPGKAGDRHPGTTLFQVALWVAVGLVVPGVDPGWNRDITLLILLVTWAVTMVTTSFGYLSSRGASITLFPAYAAFLATVGFNGAIEAAYTASIFVGFMGYSVRIGRSRRSAFNHSIRMAVISWAALRGARFISTALMSSVEADSLGVTIGMIVSLLLFVFIGILLRGLCAEGRLLSLDITPIGAVQGFLLPLAFIPLFIPAVSDIISGSGKQGDPMLLLAGSAALIAAQIATALSLEKSKWARGRSFSIQKSLTSLSKRLSLSASAVEALQALALEARRAFSPRFLSIRYAGLTIFQPAGTLPPEDAPLTRSGRAGLAFEIWADELTVLDRSRLDSFISLAEAALQNLELGKRVSLEAWSCMEAMVYSLDRADHRLSGHSRRVARLAVELGRRLGLQSGLLDSIRMSALLHHVAPAVLGEQVDETFDDQELKLFTLPEEAITGLIRMSEHFDGSGHPGGLAGSSIPMSARILAIADEFVTELERSFPQPAMNAVNQRTGTLFDPAVVRTLSAALESGFEA